MLKTLKYIYIYTGHHRHILIVHYMGHYVIYVSNFLVYLLASLNPLAIFSISCKALPCLVDAPC